MGLPKQDNYEMALSQAWLELRGRSASSVAEKAGLATPVSDVLTIPFLGAECRADLKADVGEPGTPRVTRLRRATVDILQQVLITHYLARADGAPLSGKWITFAELEDGQFYQASFAGRGEARFLRLCLANPDAWLVAAQRLGGTKNCIGDASVVLWPLPRVAVVFVLWRGDDELPSAARILFDSSVNHYLSTEDVAVLCDILLGRLKREIDLLRNIPPQQTQPPA